MVAAAVAATASLFSDGHSSSFSFFPGQLRAQHSFVGFDAANFQRTCNDPSKGKNSLTKQQDRGHCRCRNDSSGDVDVHSAAKLGCLRGNKQPAIDAFISAIASQADAAEGSLVQALTKISVEDWSKVLRNVGRKHWELALGVFGIFKETTVIILQANVEGACTRAASEGILKVYTTMVSVLSKHGRLEEAEAILVEVQELGFKLDLFLYNALLSGYARKGLSACVVETLLRMQRSGVQPDYYSYEKLVAAYLNMEQPEVGKALKVLDYLLDNKMKPGHKVFVELIKACWIQSAVDDAHRCFAAMLKAGYPADTKMLRKMMELYAQKGDPVRTEELFQMVKQTGHQVSPLCYEHILHAYCKAGDVKQAFRVFQEAKLVLKPSLITYNLLLDACSKAGLYLQALRVFNEVCKSGMKGNAATYTLAITALVRSRKLTKADDLYRKMLKHGMTPTVDTYTAMIHSYSVRGWTGVGHEISLSMRSSNCVILPSAYNAMLDLYLRGSWYNEGCRVFEEMEGKGVEPCMAAYGVIIFACGDSSQYVLPLLNALQGSRWDACRAVHQLLFQPLDESCEPLLEGNTYDEVTGHLYRFLETMAKQQTQEANLLFYNSLMDTMWRKGLKRRAKAMMLAARALLPWYKRPKVSKSSLVLDVRGLSLGAAQVAIIDCLRSSLGSGDGKLKVVLITGTRGARVAADEDRSRNVRKAVISILAELGSPFVETPYGSGRLVAEAEQIIAWQSSNGLSSAFMLLDSHQPYMIN